MKNKWESKNKNGKGNDKNPWPQKIIQSNWQIGGTLEKELTINYMVAQIF